MCECGNPPLLITSFLLGDKGKQLVPGNKGLLSIKVGALDLSIPYNSANIHPTDHISISAV